MIIRIKHQNKLFAVRLGNQAVVKAVEISFEANLGVIFGKSQ